MQKCAYVKEFVRVLVCGVRKMSAGNCCLVMCSIDLGAAQLIHQRLFSYLALGKILLSLHIYRYIATQPQGVCGAKVFAGIYK